ncbi:MAG TPA: hypothetical protein P5228_10115 [Bacteroidales bacterium]|nr:hypothetical protein [Bacteroidales bacterium]
MKRIVILVLLTIAQQWDVNAEGIDTTHFHASKLISSYLNDSLSAYCPIVQVDIDSSQFLIDLNLRQGYSCFSDFNGDKLIDYALLLRDDSNHVSLFVFNIQISKVSHIFIDNYGSWPEQFPLLEVGVEPKGIWRAADEKLRVLHDGIFLSEVNESITYAYYWNDGKYKKFIYD